MTNDIENPYKAPDSNLLPENDSLLKRKKGYIIFEPETTWPNRCYKCNAPTDHKKEVKLSYCTPWIALLIFIHIFIMIIVYLFVKKTFRIELPICDKHLKRRQYVITAQVITFLMIMGSIAIAVTINQGFTFVAIALVLFLLMITIAFGRFGHLAKFKNDELWFRGAGKTFLDSLPDYTP